MRGYNLYYNSKKVNQVPLSKNDVDEVFKKGVIYKKDPISGELSMIPTSRVSIVKCITVI